MPQSTRLDFRDLHLAFDGRPILRGLNLHLRGGHCTLLCGANGTGKSTLLRVAAGLQHPDHARVDLGLGDGGWRRCRKALLDQVVYLHQAPYMFAGTVERNLAYALPWRMPRAERAALVEQAIEWAALDALRGNPAKRLSGGERQRVALARAWLRRPRALLLDEPTANLDAASRQRTESLLLQLKREDVALLVASHDPGHFTELADSALSMHDGRLAPMDLDPTLMAAVRGRPPVLPALGPEADPVPEPGLDQAPEPPVAFVPAEPTAASAAPGGSTMQDSASTPEPLSQSAPAPGDRFPLAVLTRYQATPEVAWSDGRWRVDAVVAGEATGRDDFEPRRIRDDQWLWPGLGVSLFVDEAESYYFNLMAEQPRVFLVCTTQPGGRLKPELATLSFDEAAAYEEGDQLVTDAPMPPEVYQWLEAFVLAHYVPEKRKKRKRDNWKKEDSRGRG